LKTRDGAARHVMTLMGGTVFAQAIPIAALAVLTRFYAPEDFGVFALFSALVAVLTVAATGRYELAILIPKRDDEAAQTALLALSCSVVAFAATLFLCAWRGDLLAAWLGDAGLARRLWLAPFAVLSGAALSTLTCWANRESAYRAISLSRVALSACSALASIGLGLAARSDGLLLGMVFGSLIGCAVLLPPILARLRRSPPDLAPAALWRQARRFSAFPRINLPHALLDSAQGMATLALIGGLFGAHALGLYAMAMRARTPMGVISASMGQVFQQRAARVAADGGDLRPLLKAQWRDLFKWLLPMLAGLAWAPWLFATALGPAWREAGVFVLILLPWLAMNFMVSSLSQLPLILGRQLGALRYGLLYQAALLAPLTLPYIWPGMSLRAVFAVLSGAASLALLSYAWWIWLIAKNAGRD